MMIDNKLSKVINSVQNAINSKRENNKSRKFAPKISASLIITYVAMFLVIITVIALGYYGKNDENAINASSKSSIVSKTSVDDVLASTIAADIAKVANLSVSSNVANLAVTTYYQNEIASINKVDIAKPQIINLVSENRAVISYTVLNGDTVASLALKFKISEQTIKWANNLTGNNLVVGATLKILPIDGVLYVVKSGDTIDSIADKYKVDKSRLISYNDLELSGLAMNTTIILPDGILPDKERPGYVAPVIYTRSFGAGFGGNTWFISYGTPDNGLYAHGNCTLYAYNRRKALGLPVGDHWGNASSWAYMAALPTSQGGGGLLVDHTPSVGAIIQNSGNFYGHVAIVESILANGDISISEMNAYVSGGGYNIVSGRIIAADDVDQYNFIH